MLECKDKNTDQIKNETSELNLHHLHVKTSLFLKKVQLLLLLLIKKLNYYKVLLITVIIDNSNNYTYLRVTVCLCLTQGVRLSLCVK